MNHKSRLKQFLIIASISVGLSLAAPAMAVSLTINIDGCFSVITAGTECGNDPNTANTVFASGNFTVWDELGVSAPGTLLALAGQNFSYEASTSISAEDPITGTTFADDRSKFFPTFADLINDPRWPAALGVFQTVVAGGSLVGPGGPLGTFAIDFAIDNITNTGNHTSGTFTAFSSDSISELNLFSSSLFNRDLPLIPVNFTVGASLTAIPEPVSFALIGLGLFVMSSSLRRKI
tara:strand:+ start:614 stop:1318 length:705 start_codon:yes stop_codon:yes gene_type:complete